VATFFRRYARPSTLRRFSTFLRQPVCRFVVILGADQCKLTGTLAARFNKVVIHMAVAIRPRIYSRGWSRYCCLDLQGSIHGHFGLSARALMGLRGPWDSASRYLSEVLNTEL
jgi:hypothetical protein